MKQQYKFYTKEHQDVWRILFERQIENLQNKAHTTYLKCLDDMAPVLNGSAIPMIADLNNLLYERNGWQIHIVPGIIPASEFLQLLAEKKFCSSTWLRTYEQLDYLEEPDMFHDIFGHIPLLWDNDYADFIQKVGALGVKYACHEKAVELLERFYWFTIEFGLVEEHSNIRQYGAGIMSSFQESKSIYEADVQIHRFNLQKILEHCFTKSELQHEYFIVSSLEVLYTSIDPLDRLLKDLTEKGYNIR